MMARALASYGLGQNKASVETKFSKGVDLLPRVTGKL